MSLPAESEPPQTPPPASRRQRAGLYARYVATLALGTLGGWIFYTFHIPLAWMLGAMTVCIAGALLRLPGFDPEIVSALDEGQGEFDL